jgi:hypothetical protein
MNTRIFMYAHRLGLLVVLVAGTLGLSGLACAGTTAGANSELPVAAHAEGAKSSAHRNQLKEATNASAALRKTKGLGRTTTQDDRLAAAKRNAARKAAAAKAHGRLP